MMFTSFVTFSSLFAAVFAQGITVLSPTAGESVTGGSNITVSVQQQRTQSPFENIGIAVGIASCGGTTCTDHSAQLGVIDYAGVFDPQGTNTVQPFQDFSIQVPEAFSGSDAVITVAAAVLIGAGPEPDYSIANVTVSVA